ELDHLAAHVVQTQVKARCVECGGGSTVEHAKQIDRIQRRVGDLMRGSARAAVSRVGGDTIHRTAQSAGRPLASAEYCWPSGTKSNSKVTSCNRIARLAGGLPAYRGAAPRIRTPTRP